VIDTASMLLALLALSMPTFWLGLLLIALFSVQIHWFAVFGSTSLTSISSLVLPSVALGTGVGGVTARFVRTSVIGAARQHYVTTARSKGLKRRQVFNRHIFRNAILPVATVVGLQFGWLLSGTVVIEIVFTRPGIGALLVNSILDKDYLVVQGLVLLLTIMYAVVNLLVDIVYPWIDPRIAY
jgi:ABC-type dipeptide/oligopeptide/nickel transport system permease component